ncbi:Mitochondrial fusion and transport protein ugo1 [Hypsizygus marmoreus]|uniref:Mitochondrial fusion and transport protein ugo1 n=1 Tax=Hypsizygus marmoreus TaxID=39966 RepID=A0A369K5S0_HYPMA|nr:Mitochondrial fusion and transport protein ugo1 [Hypsizygus marmoreus]
MSTPASLRDLYIDPSSAWAFLPPASTSPPPANISEPIPSGPSYQWSSRPSHNSIFDLSPSLDLSEPSSIDVTNLVKTLVASAVLQYSSTAIAMPWEVAKLLLQVQWVPRDAGEPEEPELVEDNDDALSDDSNDDSYFADPHTTSSTRHSAPRPTDEQGYIIRRSVLEEGTRPEFIIPVGSADGVWGMIKRIGRFRGEGWLALWKGLLTSCLTEILSSTMQPLIHNFLQSLFLPTMSPFHQPPILLPVASHLITGFILSPLDLIRTRLIVQSFTSRYRTYSGPVDALSQILRDEGGLKGIYFHPHLFIPTLIDNTLRPIVSLAFPSMLASYLGVQISEDVNPLAWGLAELGGSCIGLLVTLPFETIRRRLQVQVRGTAKPLKGCVELRPAPYNGIVDTFWHILTEERSDLPIRRTRKRRGSQASLKGKERADAGTDEEVDEGGWFRNTGIGQLYRGMGMRLGASAIVFLLALLSGGEEGDGGWAEI